MVWWEVLTQTSAYPQFLAAAGMVALAAFLIYVDFNHVAHRAFALLLLFRALVMIASTLRGIYTFSPPPALGGIGNPEAANVWANLAPYFVIPLPFLILWFATVYPRRRTIFATTWWGPLLLLAIVIALEIVYFFDHSTYVSSTTAVLTHESGATWATTTHLANGPLSILLGLMYAGLAILALVFTLDYVRLPPGPRKSGLLAVVLGFVLNAFYDGSIVLISVLTGFGLFSGGPVVLLTLFALVPASASLIVLARHRMRTTDESVRAKIGRALPLALLPVASAIFAIHNPFTFLDFIQLILTGFWRLWLPALVTYALVRHQLFDIDLKIKFAVKQSTMAGVAFVGFVVLSETLEAIITSSSVLTEAVPERWTDLASLGVAVGLTYVLNPVRALAGNVANRVMPGTTGTEEYLARKRLEVFRATLEGAVEDGAMTDKERMLVEKLRAQLGLSEADVKPILADVEAAYEGRTIGRPPPAATP